VAGYNFSGSGYSIGVEGSTASSSGAGVGSASIAGAYGVSGSNSASSGFAVGMTGNTNSPDGAGILGANNASSGTGAGVQGYANGPGLNAVAGYNHGTSGFAVGVVGGSYSPNGTGVQGWNAGGGLAGQFDGPVTINGNLTINGSMNASGVKNFKIDDPLDPEHKSLYHAAIESSEMLNVYSGNVVLDTNGEATVTMPGWFQALNEDFRYQLTTIGGSAPVYIAEEMRDNRFKIAGGRMGMKVSWQVTGARHDAWAEAHPMQVEEPKPKRDEGTR
jgi:hypothetical protein